MAQTTLFKPLRNTTGDFYMFSQYADDLTRQQTYQDIYQVIPSKFAVLQLQHPQYLWTADHQSQNPDYDQSKPYIDNNYILPTTPTTYETFATYMCRAFQNYYENKVNFMRTTMTNDQTDPWYKEHTSIALWQTMMKFGLIEQHTYTPGGGEATIEYFDELKYIGDINLYATDRVDGVNYNEIYCYIPTDARRTLYSVHNVTGTLGATTYRYGEIPASPSQSEFATAVEMLGWNPNNYPSNVNVDNVCCFDMPPLFPHVYLDYAAYSQSQTPTELYYNRYDTDWVRPDLLDGVHAPGTDIHYTTTDDHFVFNTIVLFYDIKDRDGEVIERNLPLGIYFLGYNATTDNWENEMTKWVANDDIYGQGTAYGLRVANRYITTPNSTYFLSSECERNDHYAEYSNVMVAMGETLDRFQRLANEQNSAFQALQNHYNHFQNYTTNVPYIRYVNNVPTWFVNGRNTNVPAGGTPSYNEYFAGRYMELSSNNYFDCTLEPFGGRVRQQLNGTEGLVPAPTVADDMESFLHSDGTWHPTSQLATEYQQIPFSETIQIGTITHGATSYQVMIPRKISEFRNDVPYLTAQDLNRRVTTVEVVVDSQTIMNDFDIYVPDNGNYLPMRTLNINTNTSLRSLSGYIPIQQNNGVWEIGFINDVTQPTRQLNFGQTSTIAKIFGIDVDVTMPSLPSNTDTTYHIESASSSTGTDYTLVDSNNNVQGSTIQVPNNTNTRYTLSLSTTGDTLILAPDDQSQVSQVQINTHEYVMRQNANNISTDGYLDSQDLIEDPNGSNPTVVGTVNIPRYIDGRGINIVPNASMIGEYVVSVDPNFITSPPLILPGVVKSSSITTTSVSIVDGGTTITTTNNGLDISVDAETFYNRYLANPNPARDILWQVQIDQQLPSDSDPIVIRFNGGTSYIVLYDRTAEDVINSSMSLFRPTVWGENGQGQTNVAHSRFTFLNTEDPNDPTRRINILHSSWLNTAWYLNYEGSQNAN